MQSNGNKFAALSVSNTGTATHTPQIAPRPVNNYFEIYNNLRRNEEIYLVTNDSDAELLNGFGLKAANYCSPGGFFPSMLTQAFVLVITDHDMSSREAAYDLAKRIAAERDGKGCVAVADPHQGAPLPLYRGKTLSDFVEQVRAENNGNDPDPNAIEAGLYNLIWESPEFRRRSDGHPSDDETLAVEDTPNLLPIGPGRLSSAWGPEQRFVVHDTIPKSGISVMSGAPKAGKTVTAEALSVAVSKGELFLGRRTTKGRVLYFAFEGDQAEIRRQFIEMGAKGDSILIHAMSAPKTLEKLIELLSKSIVMADPSLIVVDTLGKALPSIDDLNNYAVVGAALERYVEIAKRFRVAILFLHHDNRGGEILGSTAISGAVDCILHLKRDAKGKRTLSTVGRIGTDLPPTVIKLDEHGRIVAGVTETENVLHVFGSEIRAALEKQGSITEPEIRKLVSRHKGSVVGKALRALIDQGAIVRTGEGKRGNPFIYGLPVPLEK